MTTGEKIKSFAELGRYLRLFEKPLHSTDQEMEAFENLILGSAHFNGWFVEENVRSALSGIACMLEQDKLGKWLARYPFKENENPKRVGVVMAGNIPMVGFHDFLCVLISGNTCVAKLSSQDNRLLKAVAAKLIAIEPRFKDRIVFEDGKLKNIDAVIATGSNNTSRYFEYYFGKYPHIIRKNRNSVAVLTGNETAEELALLGDDIFMYFGLGCRNVSKLYVPEGYNFDNFFNAIESRKKTVLHAKYANNYDYNKAILLVNKYEHFDNGFLLVKRDDALATPVAQINYSFCNSEAALALELEARKEQIQCIVSSKPGHVPFGQSQKPELWDYADGIDTMQFLMSSL
ncbi:MAG: hypothetical protein POELPBGB_02824 [Bacteroidia bacterium]|nr:hypothetical protein [Bacteroidia bacterium]